MAKNTGRGSRAAAGLLPSINNGIWSRQNDNTRGQFIDAKTHGGTFKGVPKRRTR